MLNQKVRRHNKVCTLWNDRILYVYYAANNESNKVQKERESSSMNVLFPHHTAIYHNNRALLSLPPTAKMLSHPSFNVALRPQRPIKNIRDGKPRTPTLTSTQLLSSGSVLRYTGFILPQPRFHVNHKT